MIRRTWNDILHRDRTHHTNIVLPRSDYINGIDYPDQYINILGKVYSLRFRNQYKMDVPEEDMDDVTNIDEHDIYTRDFYIIRADSSAPYKFVAISTDFEYILVYDNSKGDIVVDGDNITCPIITRYPIQLNEFIGLSVFDQYSGEISEILGVTLRVDNGEPCYTVICEFVANGEIRIVLGDECISRLFDYYPFIDLNAKNPDFDPTNPDSPSYQTEYEDVDGYYPLFYRNYNGEYRKQVITDAILKDYLTKRYMEMAHTIVEGYDIDGNISIDPEDDSKIIINNVKYKLLEPSTLQLLLRIYPDDVELKRRIDELEQELQRLLSDEYLGPPVDFTEINGGRADIFKNIFTQQLKDDEIAEMRKKIFKENKLYGIGEYIISD